jgi:hypothetical protein
MVALNGNKQRGGAGKIPGIERRAARQQEINHREMAESCGMAEWPGAKPVARVDRCAMVEQFGRQSDAIAVNGRKQCQRHFDGSDLRFGNFKPAT